VQLTGTAGTIAGLAFFVLWVYAMYCLYVIASSSREGFWRSWRHGTFWPSETLTPRGLKYRGRYYWTVVAAFALFAIAWVVLPH